MTDTSQDIAFRRAYRPLLELGQGGMAKVFLAESVGSGVRKLVVLKVLNADLAAEPEMRAAFIREAELSAQMNHPNVVQVFEVAEYSKIPVIAMEYLDGVSLAQILNDVGAEIPLRLHLHILTQVLAGLHHFHELTNLDGAQLGTVHRDVSPQNVVVLHDGLVKVLDFGIAKVRAPNGQATQHGMIKGKIRYMPPEQLLGDPNIDRRADVFAMGVMLWEAITRQRLWGEKTESEVLGALATKALPRLPDVVPDVPEQLLRIVERSLAVDKNDRYATAHDMQSDLEQYLVDRGEIVQMRELSDFMRKHFGSLRKLHRHQVKNARQRPSDGDETLDCFTPARPIAWPGLTESSSHGAQIATLPGRRVVPPRRSKRGLSLALLAVLAVGGVGLVRWRTLPHREPAVRTVQLAIEALPTGSEIFLDGARVGQDQYRATPASSDRKVQLDVRAPGYLSEHREVSLNSDVIVQVVLQQETPEKTETAAVSGGNTEIEAKAENDPPKSAKAPPRLPTRPAKPREKPSSTAPAAALNCNPPYTLGADGVKTYRPECF